MKNLKKILCIVLSLSMVLGAVAFAFADEEPVKEKEIVIPIGGNIKITPDLTKFENVSEYLFKGGAYTDLKTEVEELFFAISAINLTAERSELAEELIAVVAAVEGISGLKYNLTDKFNYPLNIEWTISEGNVVNFNFGVYPYIDKLESLRMQAAKQVSIANNKVVGEIETMIGKMDSEELVEFATKIVNIATDHIDGPLSTLMGARSYAGNSNLDTPIGVVESFEALYFDMAEEMVKILLGVYGQN